MIIIFKLIAIVSIISGVLTYCGMKLVEYN